MRFLVNDLSLHGQFYDIKSFKISLANVMRIRNRLAKYGHSLYLHRSIYSSKLAVIIKDAISGLSREEKHSFMSWMTTSGPFWTDDKQHLESDIFLINNENITGSALAEIAYQFLLGQPLLSSVSFSPSVWTVTPISVKYEDSNIDIDNFWEINTIDHHVRSLLPEITSWDILEQNSKQSFYDLSFLNDAFDYLSSEPFSVHIASEIYRLLDILNSLKVNFDDKGNRTSQWDIIYKEYFLGKYPRFTDSSDPEKEDFYHELVFRDPQTHGRTLFCPWHGKIHSPQIRIHFSYPITADKPLYIAYIGPKITKR